MGLIVLGRLNFAQPPLEKAAFALIGGELQGSCITLRRFREGSRAAEQVGPGRMEQMIAVELAAGGQLIDQRKRRERALHHGHGDGPVQRHDG